MEELTPNKEWEVEEVTTTKSTERKEYKRTERGIFGAIDELEEIEEITKTNLPKVSRNSKPNGVEIKFGEVLTENSLSRLKVDPKAKYKKRCKCCPNIGQHKKNKIRNLQENRFKYMRASEKKRAIRELWQKAGKMIIMEARYKRQMGHFIIEKEEKDKKSELQYLILPGSRFRIIWDLIMLILISYICLITPFVLSFYMEVPSSLQAIDYIICAIFAVDIVITFFSAYFESSQLITRKSIIAIRYIRSYLIFDIISCIPMNVFFTEESNTDDNPFKSKRMFVFLILLKLFKLGRILHFIEMFIDKLAIKFEIRPETEKGLRALMGLLFSVHIFACMWFLMARLYNFSPETWVIRTGNQDAYIGEQYLVAVYWVFQTLTTVGYGDVAAITVGERILSLILMSFGVAFYSSLFQPMDETQKKLRIKMVTLALYAKQFNVPNVLTAKIRNHIEEHANDFFSNLQHSHIFTNDLPIQLRGELIKYSHGSTLSQTKPFRNLSPNFYWKFASKFNHIKVENGLKIYTENDPSDRIYFVKKGRVNMINRSGNVTTSYTENTYFGEQEFLNNTNRSSTAVAYGQVQLYSMNTEKFWSNLKEYPEVQIEIENLAKIRKEASKMRMGITRGQQYNFTSLKTLEGSGRSTLFGESDFAPLSGSSHKEKTNSMQIVKNNSPKELKGPFEAFSEWKERIGQFRCKRLRNKISGENGLETQIKGSNIQEILGILRDIQDKIERGVDSEGNSSDQKVLINVLAKLVNDFQSIGYITNTLADIVLFLAYFEHVKSIEFGQV